MMARLLLLWLTSPFPPQVALWLSALHLFRLTES
jgi:hypothetical protein